MLVYYDAINSWCMVRVYVNGNNMQFQLDSLIVIEYLILYY